MSIYSDYPDVKCDHCGKVTTCRAVAGGFNKINAPLCAKCFLIQRNIFKRINAGEITVCRGAEEFKISYELMKDRLFDYNDIKHPELCREEAKKRDAEYMDIMFIDSVFIIMEDNLDNDTKIKSIQEIMDTFKEGDVELMSELCGKIVRDYVNRN